MMDESNLGAEAARRRQSSLVAKLVIAYANAQG
jgi:hypothetical protein